MEAVLENRYRPRGAAAELFRVRRLEADEILLDGPVRTGKSRAILELANLIAERYPGSRQLFVRKTRVSLTQSILVTWENDVRPHCDLGRTQRQVRDEYRYPNGSIIAVAGMDNPDKILSAEYDMIYPFEARELSAHDWEVLVTRLSHGVVPYQKIVGDTNPDRPTHFLKQREAQQGLRMLHSRHKDNPKLWDPARGDWTDFGRAYMAKLDKLTGVRRLRLKDGIWAAAEGLVYDAWDPELHVVTWARLGFTARGVPPNWRIVRAVDFGFTNPFVCQWWLVDPDERMYLAAEWVYTQMLVEDHARKILEVERERGWTGRIGATVCDHDAEDRATLERHLACRTAPADKALSPGIQGVQGRLKPAGDGKPRLFVLADALLARDPNLAEPEEGPPRPIGFAEEVESYAWDPAARKGERPIDKDNHSMDAARYAERHVAAKRQVGSRRY